MKRGLWAVGGVVAVLLGGCGSSSTKTVTVISSPAPGVPASTGSSIPTVTATNAATSPASSTSSSTATTPPTPSVVVHLSQFESPSGNIGCIVISASNVRCDIQHRDWTPGPRPATCPKIVDYGQGAEVARAGAAGLVCAGDTAIVPGAKKLAYGTASVVGPFRCISATSGMTCTNTATDHGFSISIQSYRVF